MKKNNKIAKAFALLLPIASLAQTSGEKGNGGDFIRQAFISRGKQIVAFLDANEGKAGFLRRNRLSAAALRGVLNIEVVKVSDEALIDNGGSSVDAIGTLKKIVLNEASWKAYLMKGLRLDRMILHEMLRAVGKNDDNYRISETAPEMPTFFDKERMSAGYRILREEFSEGRFPSDDELKALGDQMLECESYKWNEPKRMDNARMSASIWRGSALNILFEFYTSPYILYIDREVQKISGLTDANVQVTARTRTGKELLFETINAAEMNAPESIGQPSLRATYYFICALPTAP